MLSMDLLDDFRTLDDLNRTCLKIKIKIKMLRHVLKKRDESSCQKWEA